jgi:integrase
MSLPKVLLAKVKTIADEFSDTKDDDTTLKNIRETILASKPSDRTQSVRYSQVKKYFMENTNASPEFLSKIKPDEAITTKLIERNIKVRDEAKVVVIPLDTIDKLKALKGSIDPLLLAIYLLFVSGRRTAELLNARFSLSDVKGMVEIDGLVKTRNGNAVGTFRPIGTAPSFIKLVTKFQKAGVNKGTFNRLVSLRLKKLFDIVKNPHMLRGVYATYMFKHHNKDGLKINTFLKQVLNHSSILSSLSYTGYSIGPKKMIEPAPIPEKNNTPK